MRYPAWPDLSSDQLEQQQGVQENWQGAESYYTRDLINSFTQINRATGAVFNPVPKGDILDLSNSQLRVHNARGLLHYNKSWARHQLTVIAGGELRQLSNQSHSNRAYGYSREILTSAPVNYAQTYPNFVRGSQTFIPSNQDFSERLDRFVSLFSNLAYTWDGKYTASLSGRRDASNLFGVATNDKWNPLWSAGISWHLSREGFYRSGALPYLKLRATWGYSGNVDPSLSALTTLRYMDVSPYTNTPYAQIDKYYNPELRWEKIGMLNAGIDFQSQNSRVSGCLEYYAKKGRDLFGPAPVDYTVGLNTASITKNVAAMKGHGLDLELRTVNIDKEVQWTTHWNLSHNRDRVTRYYLSTQQGSQYINGGQGISGIEGKPVYSVFTYRWGGLDPQTGDPVGFLKGGESKDYASLVGAATLISDLVYHGPALPQWYGTLGNTVRWKGLALTAQLNYKFGYYFQRNSISYADLFSKGDGHGDFARRWQKPGDEQATHVPSMAYPINASRDQFYRGSEVLVSKGDHIRLQYLHLSYEWLKGKSPWLPFSQLEVYGNMQDLGIVWRAGEEGIDPDYRSGIMPPSKSFAVGIRTSF